MPYDPSSISNDGGTRPESGLTADPRLVSTVGDNVRHLREQAGWSIGDLARAASVSKSTVSTIEGGAGNPGLETLVNLSVALGVPFGALLSGRHPSVDVLRATEAPTIESAGGSFRGRLLVSSGRVAESEVYTFELDAGDAYVAEPHPSGTVETVICTSGRVVVGPVGHEVELRAGDRATFPADEHHSYRARGRAARMTLVLSYR